MPEPPKPTQGLRPAAPSLKAKESLSGLVVSSELTLISVILGVLTASLVSSAQTAIRAKVVDAYPYIVCGAIEIVALYAVVTNHTLSFVGWPLEMCHNMAYLLLALVISIQVSFVDSPLLWYGAQIVVAAVATVLVVLDYVVIRTKLIDNDRDAERIKLLVALKHQVYRLATLTAALPSAILCWLLLNYLPDAMLEHRWHLFLVCCGIVGFSIVTVAEYFFFLELREPLLRAVSEAINAAEAHDVQCDMQIPADAHIGSDLSGPTDAEQRRVVPLFIDPTTTLAAASE